MTAKAIFKLKPETEERKVRVWVVSDAYVGMKWEMEVEVPAVPKVVDEGKKRL